MSTKKRIIYLYLILLLTSPFVWVTGRNLTEVNPFKEKFIYPSYQFFVDDVNTMRGELSDQGMPKGLSRFLVNKYSNFCYEALKRYVNTFDPNFLFFSGDVDLLKSTKATGPIYLSFLIPFIFGISQCLKNKKKIVLLLLFLSPLPASFLLKEIETIFRIPFFLVFIFVVSLGFVHLLEEKKYKAIIYLTLALYIFELVRFLHDFYLHYPFR